MKFVGGRLCLDYVNTVDAWADAQEGMDTRHYGDTALREKLVDYEALVLWGQRAGAIGARDAEHLCSSAASGNHDAVKMLARALRLRRALYRIFKSVLEKWEPESVDISILHRELAIARLHERLAYRDGSFHWTWEAPPDAADRVLWPVSLSAADLLASSDLVLLRQCQGEECGWVFLDTSRNRTRHWCDMNDCGNLAKVRKFRMRARRPTVQAIRGDDGST